jgi:hypothetical protein
MELIEALAEAALRHDSLQVRSLAQELVRTTRRFSDIPRPTSRDARILAVAAGLVELLALRAGQSPPSWTSGVGASPEPHFLLDAARTMKRLRRLCQTESPEPLRKRSLYAPPEYLTFV